MGVVRAAVVVVTAAAMVGVSAGCTSSGHPHVQSPSPRSSSDGPESSGSTTPASSTTTTLPPVPTPTVAPVGQKAVDAYIALYQALAVAGVDPAHADFKQINRYLTPSVQTTFDEQFTQMAKDGIAYRGYPDDPRVKLIGLSSLTTIMLSSCPLASPTNPAVQYYVRTGKPVPVKTASPPPPYKKLIQMTFSNGTWKLADLVSDTSKTCSG